MGQALWAGNAMEEAAQRYWRALRIWRGAEDPGDMTVEDLIMELNDLQCFRGSVPVLATKLLDDVIHDRRSINIPILEQTQTA